MYQSLARWFVTSWGTDFAGLVRSSFPHLLPDVVRDFASGSSLFLTTLLSVATPSQTPPPSSVSSSATHPPLSAHLSSASLPGVPPHPSSLAQFHPSAPPVSSFLPPPPGFSHPTSSLAFPIQGSSEVHGLGVGVPSSSGVPRSLYYMSAAPAYGASTSASWHPPSHTLLILLCLPLLTLRPVLFPTRMSITLRMTMHPLIHLLLPYLWIQLDHSIGA